MIGSISARTKRLGLGLGIAAMVAVGYLSTSGQYVEHDHDTLTALSAKAAAGDTVQWDGSKWAPVLAGSIGDYADATKTFTDEWFPSGTLPPSPIFNTTHTSGTGAAVSTNGVFGMNVFSAGLQSGTTTTGESRLSSVRFDVFIPGSNPVQPFNWFSYEFTSSGSSQSAVSNEFAVLDGFVGTADTLTPSEGCFALYDRGNVTGWNTGNSQDWICACEHSSVATHYVMAGTGNSDESSPLGTVPFGFGGFGTTTSATSHIKIKFTTGASPRAEWFACLGDSCSKVCDINTNIPNSSSGVLGLEFMILKSTGTTTANYSHDFDQLQVNLVTPRSP